MSMIPFLVKSILNSAKLFFLSNYTKSTHSPHNHIERNKTKKETWLLLKEKLRALMYKTKCVCAFEKDASLSLSLIQTNETGDGGFA